MEIKGIDVDKRLELKEYNYHGFTKYLFFKEICFKCNKQRLCYRITSKSLYEKIKYVCRNCALRTQKKVSK